MTPDKTAVSMVMLEGFVMSAQTSEHRTDFGRDSGGPTVLHTKAALYAAIKSLHVSTYSEIV